MNSSDPADSLIYASFRVDVFLQCGGCVWQHGSYINLAMKMTLKQQVEEQYYHFTLPSFFIIFFFWWNYIIPVSSHCLMKTSHHQTDTRGHERTDEPILVQVFGPSESMKSFGVWSFTLCAWRKWKEHLCAPGRQWAAEKQCALQKGIYWSED